MHVIALCWKATIQLCQNVQFGAYFYDCMVFVVRCMGLGWVWVDNMDPRTTVIAADWRPIVYWREWLTLVITVLTVWFGKTLIEVHSVSSRKVVRCGIRQGGILSPIDVKNVFTFFILSGFYVFKVFCLSAFFVFKNVHSKFHQDVPEVHLKPQKWFNKHRLCNESADCRAVRQAVPIATRLLRRHAV